jgi:hypothetical protein
MVLSSLKSRDFLQFYARASGHLRLYTVKPLVDNLEIYGFKIISRKGTPLPSNQGFLGLIDRALHLINAYGLLPELMIVAKK